MVYLSDPSGAFLASKPDWSLSGALLSSRAGTQARVEQQHFHWVDGGWQAEVAISPVETLSVTHTVNAILRVTPDTLRRWKEVGIDPFLEACAQLQDYWRSTPSDRLETLTLL